MRSVSRSALTYSMSHRRSNTFAGLLVLGSLMPCWAMGFAACTMSTASSSGDGSAPPSADAGAGAEAASADAPTQVDGGGSGSDAAEASSVASSGNLIVNGDAESGTGSPDGTPVSTPGWTSMGNATAIVYGANQYPSATDPGPPDRGKNFLVGGPSDAMSSLSQTDDVSRYAAAIDADHVTYTLSGWLGGFAGQEDNAVLTVTFQGSGGASLGTATIGPVTAEDRTSQTGLLSRMTTGKVPTGTRGVGVLLSLTRLEGTANDGYADDLSLTFNGI